LYEARGLIPPAIRQGQYRYYHAEHLRFIDVIKLAQRAGFRLSELMALLGVKQQQGHIPLQAIEQAIADKLAQQHQQIQALQQQQQVLVDLRQVCQQLFAQPVGCVEPQQLQQGLDSAL
jgi:DNA-binding transcriptional MerR regulator